MKRTLLSFVVAVLAFAIGITVVRMVDSRLDQEPPGVVPIVLLANECIESETPKDFTRFWFEFRASVEAQDKLKLFSMTRTCGFHWQVGNSSEELRQPLASTWQSVPFQLSPPFEVRPLVRSGRSGGTFVFQSTEDFLGNYDVIFSERIIHRILSESPLEHEGVYKIRWRDDGLNSLWFDCLDDGCKFKGREWEPLITSPSARIEMQVTFLPPSEGGRKTPPILVWESGSYRPHIVIGDPRQRKAMIVDNETRETYLGIVFVSGPAVIHFGEPVEAEALLMYYPSQEYDSVIAGAEFTIREGHQIVGYGRVKGIFIDEQTRR